MHDTSHLPYTGSSPTRFEIRIQQSHGRGLIPLQAQNHVHADSCRTETITARQSCSGAVDSGCGERHSRAMVLASSVTDGLRNT
jgi:hypothetical protein